MSSASDEAAVGIVKVSADGKDWRDVSPPVTSIDIEDHEHLTDKASIVFDDQTGVLAHASMEGVRVRVRLGWQTEQVTVFEGIVTEGRSVTSQAGQQYQVTALDYTYLMSRNIPKEPKNWPDGKDKTSQTLSEIVTAILAAEPYKGYNIKPFDVEPLPNPTFTVEQHLTQANESDWDFIQRLARDYNCRAFIEYNGKEGRDDKSPEAASNFFFVPIVVLATEDPIGALTCCRGRGDLISFDYNRISSGALVEITTTTVDPATGEVVGNAPKAATPIPEVSAAATDHIEGVTPSQATAVQALVEVSASAVKQIEVARGRAASEAGHPEAAKQRIIPDPTRVAGLSGTGVANGTVLLRAKSRVTIYGVAPWAAGEWYLTKVNHVFRRQTVGTRRTTSFVSNFTATR
jgi:hypothetical protein